jgi:hypothetical protein
MQTNSPWIHASKTLACKHTGKGKSQQCKEDGKTKNNNTREVGMQLGSWPSWPAHPHNIENKHDVSTKPCPQRKPVQNWKRTKGGITWNRQRVRVTEKNGMTTTVAPLGTILAGLEAVQYVENSCHCTV